LLNTNEVEIKKTLTDRFSKFELPTANAGLSYEKDPIIKEKINFKIEKEKLGKIINYDKSLKILKDNLAILNNSPITLYSKNSYPEIYSADTLNSVQEAEEIITIAPITMIYEDKNWEINKEALAGLLEIKIKEENNIKKTYIGLGLEKFTQYLDKNILPEINQPPIDAKFELKEGRVTEFIPSQDGLKVDIEKSLAAAEEEILNNNKKEVSLFVIKDKSKISIKDINDLGIREIIGTGKSNFSGSPSNRRHNIKVGADSLNGLLIKPGEEFSLIKALGSIDASSGYLPELVIKDNKTIPEYGGGLCQIGTTVFRGAIETGLPITLRRNHSYRVAYYEPAGTDATIYDPWPDLRFINDSDKHILIQSRIEGDDIYFDFWGTQDGRIIKKTDPVIYNIVKPGQTKLIETLDLAPGVKKCTERAHNGADAYFDYKVIYADGKIKEERFTSHYVPWREVCLIGVEKLTEEAEIIEKKIVE
jgi:vancomycin resistance protein YoaR